MKHFLQKTVLYTALFALFALLVCVLTSLLAHPYMMRKGRGSVIDKNRRLAMLPSPKVVLVGGSNVCYGINSKMLQDSLHMPVVDMTINADVGMLFYYNQVKPFIHKNDIVIGIPEYGADDKIWGDESMYELGIAEAANLATITPLQWVRLPLYLGAIIKDNYAIIFSDKAAVINNGRELYNAWGDYTGHQHDSANLSLLPANKREKSTMTGPIASRFSALVEDFDSFCRLQRATYLHAYPVYARPLYNKEYALKLRKALHRVTIIGLPENYLYTFNQLYDSPNHLVFSMRNQRTRQLIADVKEALTALPHKLEP